MPAESPLTAAAIAKRDSIHEGEGVGVGVGSNLDMDIDIDTIIGTEIDIDIIEPRAGRVVIFTADAENPHQVHRVLSGTRYVLSFWFTCEAQREFQIFLDGKAHTVFSQHIKTQLKKQEEQKQQQQQQQQQSLKKSSSNEL